MLKYIILAGIWIVIVFAWLILVIRKRIIYEIYAAFGLGFSFTLMTFGCFGWFQRQQDILSLQILQKIGIILSYFAILIAILSIISLKLKGKPTSGWEHTSKLIDSSIFRMVRHPLYLGGAIWNIGMILAIQLIPSTILGIIGFFCFWIASRKEDEFNIKKFGDEYREYMKKVPMWNFLKLFRKR